MSLVDELSWENAWKDGFQPIAVGDKLMIIPKWWVDKVQMGSRKPWCSNLGWPLGQERTRPPNYVWKPCRPSP